MRLLEYQGKELFSKYGIMVPAASLTETVSQAIKASKELSFPLVIKSQLTVGGRGKAGAVLKCYNEQELISNFNTLLNKQINGEYPQGILIEKMVDITKELYLSIFLNRGKRCYSIIASSEGGMDIETVDKRIVLDAPLSGISTALAEDITNELKLDKNVSRSFIDFIVKLSKLVIEEEAELAEINPVAILPNGCCLALDSKVIIDDNSIFRHPELKKYQKLSELQAQAEKNGFSFVELDGDIAIIGNGAGLVMSTLDIVNDHGGKPGAFLDFGGRATTQTIYRALEVISKLTRIKAILVNLFGGIVRTDLVAQAILDAYNDGLIEVPIYARISGAESERAKQMLYGSRAKLYNTVDDAIVSLTAKPKLENRK
jgi:succinyl-CoA synthetase beta subunit